MNERRRGGGTGINRPATIQGYGFRNMEQQERFRLLCELARSKNGGDWRDAVPLVWEELEAAWETSKATVGRTMQAFTEAGLVESVHRGNQKRGSHYLIYMAEEFLGLCERPGQGGQQAWIGDASGERLGSLHDREHEVYTEDGQFRR